jgi:predicted negative regulator of RcsB-dependent stress response
MLTRIKDFVKENQDDIILFIGVVLISLFCFALGFITAKQQDKEPIKVEYFNEQKNS